MSVYLGYNKYVVCMHALHVHVITCILRNSFLHSNLWNTTNFCVTGYVWTLVFSTSQHGFSLNSMYRKMTRIESPILLVIQDTDLNVSNPQNTNDYVFNFLNYSMKFYKQYFLNVLIIIMTTCSLTLVTMMLHSLFMTY